ncbi:hypothetical protein Taro_022141 [Colocasia esculenta]|uniref:Uncharacterized protein n=1 Tax=Colocasia esculenta TaxID=4460 RepID=A0A843V0Q2_COLES|nr:hypothetical protein [Colocasia esculenta]
MVAEILLQPWLREVGVVERRPVRTSRDVMIRRSNRPQHHEALYFPHRRLWTTEYLCKVGASHADAGSYPGSTPGTVGGPGTEGWLDDRRTCGIVELRKEMSWHGAIPVGARGGFGVNREIAGGSSVF